MPDEIEIDWGVVAQKGAEAFAEYVGGALGELLFEQLFQTGRSNVDMFKDAIKDLKQNIKQTVDEAFLREYTGKTIGLEENLGTYMRTKDAEILDEILNDSSQLVQTYLQFDSLEVLVNLVRITTVYLTTLEALSKERNNPSYREEWKSKVKSLGDRIEKIAKKYDEPIRNSFSDKCEVNLHSFKPSNRMVGNRYVRGIEYKAYAHYRDLLISHPTHQVTPFHQDKWKQWNFRHDDTRLELNMFAEMENNEKENESVFLDCEKQREDCRAERIAALDKVIVPTQLALSKWREAVDKV